jgi:hypothetical protein
VHAAYRELGHQATRWFAALTDERNPWAVRVSFTSCAEPYADAQELSESVRLQRSLEVAASRYDRDREHPGLDTELGGSYDRLRAVHDIVSHGWLRYSFDRDGEYSAWCTEHTMYTGIARWALATELHAEHSVLWTSGALAEHKAVLLEPGLLAQSLSAGRSP